MATTLDLLPRQLTRKEKLLNYYYSSNSGIKSLSKILLDSLVKSNSWNIPYSGKVWQVESLANLANHLQFAKLKLVVTTNNLLNDLFIC